MCVFYIYIYTSKYAYISMPSHILCVFILCSSSFGILPSAYDDDANYFQNSNRLHQVNQCLNDRKIMLTKLKRITESRSFLSVVHICTPHVPGLLHLKDLNLRLDLCVVVFIRSVIIGPAIMRTIIAAQHTTGPYRPHGA